MRFCWQQHVVYCVPKTPIPSPRFVLSTTLSPSLRSCSRLLFPRGTLVTCKEKSLPCRRIAAKTPHRQIPDPTPAPVQNPALPRDRQQNQYAYQFAHEFCHVLSGYEGLEGNPNNWFHETICELASVFTLRRMAERWPTHPPYPNWAGYSKHLLEYALLPVFEEFPAGWNAIRKFPSSSRELKCYLTDWASAADPDDVPFVVRLADMLGHTIGSDTESR